MLAFRKYSLTREHDHHLLYVGRLTVKALKVIGLLMIRTCCRIGAALCTALQDTCMPAIFPLCRA